MSRQEMFPGTSGNSYDYATDGGSYGGSNGSSGGGFNPLMGILGGGMLGSGLAGMFGGFNNPASAGMSYLNQIGGANQQYLNPYNEMGQQAFGNLNNTLSGLMSNPGAFANQIGSNFHQSPGFQFALNQAMQGGNRGMAAGGLAGSAANQMQNMQTATGMGNQNYYNYLNNAENLFGKGVQGEMGLA